jgi:peptidyl-prolyl cis-trans isomerase SurA
MVRHRGAGVFVRAGGVDVLVQPSEVLSGALDRTAGVVTIRASPMKLLRLISVLVAFFCCAASLRAELADGIKAIVNNTVITYAQVEDYAAPAVAALRQEFADQPDTFQQQLVKTLNDSLEQLVERQLILHDFDAEGYKLPDSVVDELVQDRIRERFGDRITCMKTLQAQGMTFEQFREEVRDQYIEYQMRLKNVSQEIIVSPYRVESYYRDHQDDYKVGDEVKLRMIVLNKSDDDDTNTLNLARDIRTKIKEGASFQQMASVYSQGSQQKEGGDWGWVERSVLRKELADVAFKLKPGEVSDVIDTPDACYLMLVEQTRPAHVKPLSEVRNDIETTLRTQQQARLEKQWIDSLKKKTFILIFP